MKCSKCGAELSDDTKFCSYCGEKVNQAETIPPMPDTDETPDEKPVNDSAFTAENSKPLSTNKIKEIWDKLSKFEKTVVVGIALFVLSGLIAFIAGKTFAVIIAISQIVLTVVALLVKKQVIKASKSWISIVALALSFVLIIPYVSVFNVDMSKNEKYKWTDIILSDIIPEPKSNFGEIISNSSDYLSIYIYKTSAKQYNEYVTSCKDKGFTVDAEQTDHSFDGYNESGFKLSLYYYESDKEMHIDLDAAMELGTIKWPDSEFAKLLPVPKSTVGKIEKDDDTGFVAYVGETPLDDYKSYIADCADKGFTVDVNKTDKSFSAKNESAYKITVDYQGNNIMCISVYEPEYDVSIEVDCMENWIFSKYDVEVYVDDSSEGTLKHGGNDIYDVTLKKGTHTIMFENAEDDAVTGKIKVDISKNTTLKFKISCTSSSINIEDVSDAKQTIGESEGTSSTDSSQISVTKSASDFKGMNYKDAEKEFRAMGFSSFEYETVETEDQSNADETICYIDITEWLIGHSDFSQGDKYDADSTITFYYYDCNEYLTIDNNVDFATLMKITDQTNATTMKSFVNTYNGKTIEFDGCIVLMMNYKDYKGKVYDTRFDICIAGCDYGPNRVYGPLFGFENVGYYDMHVSGSDTVSQGMNFKIVAKIDGFNDEGNYIILKPVSLTKR